MNVYPDGRVFHGPLGGKLKPDTVLTVLNRDVIRPLASRFPPPEGEPGFADGKVHSFRHYFCSACANTGVPEQMLMLWLGHRDSKMVRRYYHGNRQAAKDWLNKVQFVDGRPVLGVRTTNHSEVTTCEGNKTGSWHTRGTLVCAKKRRPPNLL